MLRSNIRGYVPMDDSSPASARTGLAVQFLTFSAGPVASSFTSVTVTWCWTKASSNIRQSGLRSYELKIGTTPMLLNSLS